MNHESILTVLLIFYIIIFHSKINLLSDQLSEFINNEKLLQHFIGYLTVLLVYSNFNQNNKIFHNVTSSILIYVWFIVTRKLDLQWTLVILLLLVFGYFIEYYANRKNNIIRNDSVLDQSQKHEIIENNNNYIWYFTMLIIIVTIGGLVFYTNDHTEQFGGSNFDLLTFVFY